MNEARETNETVDEELTLAPVHAHGWVVTPAASMSGRYGASEDETGGWRWAWLRIQPTRATVQDARGAVTELALTDPNTQRMVVTAGAALAVAVISLMISAWARMNQRKVG